MLGSPPPAARPVGRKWGDEMRRVLIGVATSAMLLTACGGGTSGGGASSSAPAPTSNAPVSAADCVTAASSSLKQAGTLLIGTDNPAYPPYYQGGETDAHPNWQFNDPYTGAGFEAAVAYAVAERLGFTQDQVEWTVAPFNQTYKPGPTAWDFAIEQISFSEKRAQAVDLLTEGGSRGMDAGVVGALQELLSSEGNAYVRERSQSALHAVKASAEIY